MLTDPIQENIFREEEFEDNLYRKTLLAPWMKILAGIGAAAGMVLLALVLTGVFTASNDKTTDAALIIGVMVVVSFFSALFLTGSIALIQLIREKKWAIYGSFLAALSHMLILIASLPYTGFTPDDPLTFSIAVIFYAAVFLTQLLFMIKLVIIFKRWLIYKPSRKKRF